MADDETPPETDDEDENEPPWVKDPTYKGKWLAKTIAQQINVMGALTGMEFDSADVVFALGIVMGGLLASCDGQMVDTERENGIILTDDDRLQNFVKDAKDYAQLSREQRAKEKAKQQGRMHKGNKNIN